MGKGWAKGLTAATDPRVARAAAAHRGMLYQRRKPLEECRWPLAGLTTLPLEWYDEMAYVVGLTATDGCLFTGRRKINFKSKDPELVATYLRLLGRSNPIKKARKKKGRWVFYTQFHDSRLYEWFRSVGLTPRKSFTLGGFPVPDDHLLPLLRGLLDGDGSVLDVSYNGSGKARGRRYRTLIARFNSASRTHILWVRERISSVLGLTGGLGCEDGLYELSFAKRASLRLLPCFTQRARLVSSGSDKSGCAFFVRAALSGIRIEALRPPR